MALKRECIEFILFYHTINYINQYGSVIDFPSIGLKITNVG